MIPILEWTQVSVALGGFCGIMLESEMGLWIFLVWSLVGHGDQDGCVYVLSS